MGRFLSLNIIELGKPVLPEINRKKSDVQISLNTFSLHIIESYETILSNPILSIFIK
jgi:hypothetical protein